jgi:NitT/TauT family transport system substrate-binding protein
MASRVAVSLCDSSTSGTHIVPLYALEKGIFAKHGLDVTLTTVNSGSRAIVALISGSAQLCQLSGSAVGHAVVAGGDAVIVGALVDTYVYSLVVSPDIRSPVDLKGKAVAVSAIGSSSDTAMRLALRTMGLQHHREVAILAIGSQAERMAALEAGYVAGTLISFPEVILAREKGFRVLLDLSTMDLPSLHTGTVTSRAFLRSNRTTVLNFMKAMTEAVFAIKRDREGALAVLGKHTQLDGQKDVAALDETYDVFLKRKFVDVPTPSRTGLEAMLAEIARENPEAARLTPEDVADFGVVQELEDDGFFRELLGRE